ncbi:MAG TPA: ABC transporter substrate-binding protein [Stellaceae bacterium]|nr:ABC transporter substrate-binding protein [Stellaceae bacterium]
MGRRLWLSAAALLAGAALAAPPAGAAQPKYGGELIYMIPAASPPSFDGHREETYATIHSVAPFYSVLIRINPYDPSSSTDFVCDVCTAMPKPTDGGTTYTFKIRNGIKFHNGDPLTAADVAASWHEIIFPPQGVLSPRAPNYLMVKDVEAAGPDTVVFHLKFATNAFLPALASPYAFIYQKKVLDKDPHWYEQHIMGSGPFKFAGYEIGQSIKGVRDPDYYHKGLPYLDGFTGIYAPKQAVQIDAIRADRAMIEFRGYPPSAINQLKEELDGKIKVQTSDWNCGSVVFFNHKKKPFDDVRVRKALTLAIDRWGTAPALSKIADVHTVGSIIFPGSPLAPTKAQLETIPGFWPDINKSRAEARKLLKEAGQQNLSFDLLNRNVDQPYKYVGTWLIDQWSKIGVHATQKVEPTGPWIADQRSGNYSVVSGASCESVVDPVVDVYPYLPLSLYPGNTGFYHDPHEAALYEKMLHASNPDIERTDVWNFTKWVMGDQVHAAYLLWWYRMVPERSYVHGWKVSPSHYINQDLSTIWLAPPKCGKCTASPPSG